MDFLGRMQALAELTLAYEAQSTSSGIPGRAICSARNHHWVSDDTGSGGAVGAGELFCSSLAACAVNLVGRVAGAEKKTFGWMEVKVGAYRDMDKPLGEISLYDSVKVEFEVWGVTEEDAEYLVKAWKQR